MAGPEYTPLPNKVNNFKCPEHLNNISNKFQTYYKTGNFSDVTLVAGIDSVKVKAHRLVLSTASTYFECIFLSDEKEASASATYTFPHTDGAILRLVLGFMYTASIEIRSENVKSVLSLADSFMLDTLKAACCAFIGQNIDPSNCLGMKLFAEHRKYTNLFVESSSYCSAHFEEACEGREFLQLTDDELVEVISSDDLSVSSEEIVFNSIVSWVTSNKKSREPLFSKLLPVVRYQYLNPRFILKNRHAVGNTELICSWLNWHLFPEFQIREEIKPRKYFHDNQIAVIVGRETDKLQIATYNRELDIWTNEDIPRLPSLVNRTCFSSIVIDNKLIIVGGKINTLGAYGCTNKVECLNLRTMELTSLPPMHEATTFPKLVLLENDLYAFYEKHGSISGEKYSFSDCIWQTLEHLELPELYFQVAACGGLLYLCSPKTLHCYDPQKKEWLQKSGSNLDIVGGELIEVDGIIYFVQKNRIIKRYNAFNDNWESRSSKNFDRLSAHCVVSQNKIVALRRLKTGELKYVAEEYDHKSNEWKTLAPLETQAPISCTFTKKTRSNAAPLAIKQCLDTI